MKLLNRLRKQSALLAFLIVALSISYAPDASAQTPCDGFRQKLETSFIGMDEANDGTPQFYFWLEFYISIDCGQTWTLIDGKRVCFGCKNSEAEPDGPVNPTPELPGQGTFHLEHEFLGIQPSGSSGIFEYELKLVLDSGGAVLGETVVGFEGMGGQPKSASGSSATGLSLTSTNPDFVLQISPNPAKDLLQLKWDGDGQTAVFYDMNGRAVRELKLETGTQRLDVSGLERGLYLIKVGNLVERFIKE